MMEEKIRKVEFVKPRKKGLCPECGKIMTELNKEFRCYSCGIGVEK